MNNKTIHIKFESLIKLYRRELSLEEVHIYKQHLHTCTDCSNMLKAIEAFETTELIQPKNNQKKWNNLFNKFSFGLKYVNAVAACFLLFFVLNVSKNEIGKIHNNSNDLKLPPGLVDKGKFFATDYIQMNEIIEIKEGSIKICSDAEPKIIDKPNKTSEHLTIPTRIVNGTLIDKGIISFKIGTSIQEGSFSICEESAKSEPTENGKDYNYKKVVKALYREKVEPVEFDLNINSLANEVLSGETKVESRGILSTCTSNNRLDVIVKGIHNTGTKIIPGLSNKVRKVITEGVCRDFRDSTSPTSIKFKVRGSNIESYNTRVTSIDKASFAGFPYAIENNDVVIADQSNSINFDYFLFKPFEKKFNISINPVIAAKDMTIFIPVSEIDSPTRETRYRATALNANGNVVTISAAKLLYDPKLAFEIRLDRLQFKNVPSNATSIRLCTESHHSYDPSFMIGSVAVSSKQAKHALNCLTSPAISGQSNCPGTTCIYTHSVGGLSCKQVFTIGNRDTPAIACNSNIEYVCEEDIYATFPDYFASCGASAIEKGEPVIVGKPGCAGTSYTYNFSVSDTCGRSTSCEQVFVIKEDCKSEVQSNYSDYVANLVAPQNDAYIIKNYIVTVYDYNISAEYEDRENYKSVTGLENLAANEAFYAATKIAEYLKNIRNVEMAPINKLANGSENLNDAIYKISHNAILLGKGDDEERNSLAALDITTYEMTHHLIKSIALNHQNCSAFGSIEIKVLEYGLSNAILNYTYNLYDELDSLTNNSLSTPQRQCLFNNLQYCKCKAETKSIHKTSLKQKNKKSKNQKE